LQLLENIKLHGLVLTHTIMLGLFYLQLFYAVLLSVRPLANTQRVKINHCLLYSSVYICWPISVIFDTKYTEKIGNIKVIDLPTAPT